MLFFMETVHVHLLEKNFYSSKHHKMPNISLRATNKQITTIYLVSNVGISGAMQISPLRVRKRGQNGVNYSGIRVRNRKSPEYSQTQIYFTCLLYPTDFTKLNNCTANRKWCLLRRCRVHTFLHNNVVGLQRRLA